MTSFLYICNACNGQSSINLRDYDGAKNPYDKNLEVAKINVKIMGERYSFILIRFDACIIFIYGYYEFFNQIRLQG